MKIPKRIKIGGHWVKVKYPYVFKDSLDNVGQTDYTERFILVASMYKGTALCESEIAETFFHEILHQVVSIYSGDQLEEKVHAQISQGLFQVLRDNDLDFRK